MRSMRFSRACIAALLATLLLTTVTALAKDTGDFYGYYKVSHTDVQEDQVKLTLSLQVHNGLAADARHAVIVLRQNTGLDLVGKTKPIAVLSHHSSVTLSQQFTIARREYEKWKQGGSQPDLSIAYHANGTTWERPIRMLPKDF